MARRRKVTVDARTDKVSTESLVCRTLGHGWDFVPQGAKRRAELQRLGQREQVLYCIRCSRVRPLIVDSDGEVVGTRSVPYPAGYLLPKGSGRLPRREARKALYARQGV